MTLKEEAQKIQDFLEITMSDSSAEVVNRGNDLVVYIARTGEMLAQAKLALNEAMKNEAMQVIKDFIIDKKLSAKVQNALIDGLCKEQKYMVDWLDRLNTTCTHQLDWCRTLVSKNKEEMKLNNIGKEFQ
jgi:hypothetical protein